MVSLSKVMVSSYDNQTREGMTMTVPNQEKTTQEAHNRAVVCVIAGLTVAQAERISAVIIHEKTHWHRMHVVPLRPAKNKIFPV